MATSEGFVAYPSQPGEIGRAIEQALIQLRDNHNCESYSTWQENDISGRFIVDPILEKIASRAVLVADVTKLNFNVTYEVGYAIGRGKRVVLARNASLVGDDSVIREVGVFDTLGWKPYANSNDLVKLLLGIDDVKPIPISDRIHKKAPVYTITCRHKTDVEIKIISRIKKARIQFRAFDPEEQGRMAAPAAIADVSSSLGVVVPLLPSGRAESTVHNMRAAFVAGLTHGMDKLLLILQGGDDPVPLDYRDLVSSYKDPDQIKDHIGEFAKSSILHRGHEIFNHT
jgi:hypothetical protein